MKASPIISIPRGAVGQSIALGLASLGYHISHIVYPRADKKMVHSDTTAIVAMVANNQIFRNGSVSQFPGKSMDPDFGQMLVGSPDSIASPIYVTLPFPASIFGTLHLFPKSFFGCLMRVYSSWHCGTQSLIDGITNYCRMDV